MVNTETGQRITRRQYQKIQYGGKSIEARTKEVRKTRSSVTTHRAKKTRALKAEIKEVEQKAKYINNKEITEDARVINKFLRSKNYKRLTASEKRTFRDLFVSYPKDTVRNWLGSPEESRQMRRIWDEGIRA